MSCNLKPGQTDYYIPEKIDFDDFHVDQAVIIRAGDLSKIPFLEYKEEQEECPRCDDLYPYVNAYYNHTEDADPLSKVDSLLAQTEILESIRDKENERITFKYDAYTEREAQIRYLESKPVSFIILGKPDIGQQELGKELANYWKCVYIEPQTLIEEEIESGSRAGECIEFNLRCGRAVGIDIILKLVEQRVKSESAKHRGFVLCGLPVIPNDMYEEDPVSSQSAVFTAKDIFDEVFTVFADLCIAPSNPQVSVSSKYLSDVEESSAKELDDESQDAQQSTKRSSISVEETVINQQINIGKDYEKQLDFLFGLLEAPFFIVYIQCGTIDVLNKRDSYRFDVSSNQTLDLQRRSYNHAFRKLLIEQNDVDIIDEIFDPNVLNSEDFRLKHLVKLPRDFKASVSSQLDHYHYTALRFIQNRVLAHNPEYYVKVDGRTSIDKMLNILKTKLKIMNVQQVVIPTKLTDNYLEAYFKTEDTLLGEDVADVSHHEEDEATLTPQECFKQFRKRQAPSRTYLWSWSEWGAICPVSMKSGFIQEGKAKYAVQFMNKIYFLTDQDAYLKFYQNPRPFLLPPFPRSACRIFIFGPKRSGRSALAHCLAYYLGGTVLSSDELMHNYMQQRQDEYLEKVRQQAIAEGIALLNESRALEAEEKESNRIEQIKEWVKTVLGLLEEMSNLFTEIEKEEKKEQLEISSFPMAMKRLMTTEVLEDSEFAVALLKMREQLQDLNIPIYKLEIATWKSFITERRKLLQYLPPEISQKHQPKPATVFDDFVKEYVDAALANAGLGDIQISGGGILEMFVSHIKAAEEKYRSQGFGRGGWIIDGMLCNLKIVQDFFPDYTADDIIVLQDSSNFLIKNYAERKTTFFADFREFFMSIGMHDAAWRTPSLTSTQKYKEDMVKSILNEILENECFYERPESNDLKMEPRVEEYKEEIRGFQRDWASVCQFYLDNNISPIEVDVSGKTMPELFKSAIKSIEVRYAYTASRMTEADRADEVANMGHQEIEDQSAGEATTLANTKSEDIVEQIRRYGDTLHFCPVTFSENAVLWKGKEELAVKHNEKVYLLATEPDMQKFVKDPSVFVPQEYPAKLPPPRICVVGVTGCGKTYLSKSISENYGLVYLSYEQFLKTCYNISTSETLAELGTSTTLSDLRSYLNSNSPLPGSILEKLKMYWYEEPFRSTGFVFDDFPKSHFDVDCMVENKLIPDVVLYPQAEDTYLKTKFLDRYLKSWQEAMDKQRQETETKYSKALEKWREQRAIRFNALIEERREKRYAKKLELNEPLSENPESPETKNVSLVSFDSVADQEDTDEVNKILDSEMPPLIFDVPVPNPSSFISKTEPLIFNRIQSDTAAINLTKQKCIQQQIPVTEIPLDLDQFHRTKIASFLTVGPIKFRNRSYFESCYDVSLDVAERLLSSGYMFLSKFGKTCPVQYYEKDTSVQMYQVAEENSELFSVIHRSYIYFLVGDERRKLFKNDPLKYIDQEFKFSLLSYRVAITGPPKCGKTILSKRVEKEFGFKLITRGQAARYVLKYLFESDLAKNMEAVLRKGWELTDEMVVRSVEALTFDPRAITRGVVFDGFPNSLNETKHLAYLDLVPNIIIDLEATREQVLECLSYCVPKSDLPKFGPGFVMHLYDEWSKEAVFFREWFDKEYQAMTKIPIDTCNWSVWHQSKDYFLSTFSEITHYHVHVVEDWPLRLGNMLITPLEFLERQSSFKTFCPVCLHVSNSLVNGGDPPDRTGLIHFRNYFYWICTDHMDLFLKRPEMFLPPYNQHGMPASLPRRASFESMPENVYEDGACAVCYKTKRIITKGKLTLAATFNDKAYLFDSIDCLNVFLKNPSLFLFKIEFRAPVYPELKYTELPILGMLEQYLAKYIVQAISFIAKRRPVIPGLSIAPSALIGLGLFIKLKNETPNPLKSYYEEGFRLYNERRENLLKYLDIMKKYRNPYLHYEEPLPRFQLPPASVKSESLTTMVSRIVDQCVDNMDMYLRDVSSTGSSSVDF